MGESANLESADLESADLESAVSGQRELYRPNGPRRESWGSQRVSGQRKYRCLRFEALEIKEKKST